MEIGGFLKMGMGERLKERRIQLNLSRKELGNLTFITPQAIANYENNVSVPKLEIIVKLMEVLECDANFLYQDYIINPYREDINLTENELFIIKKYRQLNSHGKNITKLIVDEEYSRMLVGLENEKRVTLRCYIPRKAENDTYTFDWGYYKNISVPMESLSEPTDFCIEIPKTDALTPIYNENDIIAVQKGTVCHNEIGACIVDHSIQICKFSLKNNKIRLFPFNVNREPFTITDEQSYKLLGKVVGKITGNIKEII